MAKQTHSPGSESPLRLIKRCAEFIEFDKSMQMPRGIRGIYVLYKSKRAGTTHEHFDVVYVGMATGVGGIRSRLRTHRRKKRELWTHCSVFEVWNNIRDDEIIELEGLFRHIYRYDSVANELNRQRGFKKLKSVTERDIETWAK